MYFFISFLIIVRVVDGSSFDNILRTTDCKEYCSNKVCRGACNNATTGFEPIPQIDEVARANVTLHCKGTRLIIIQHNIGTYAIEKMSEDEVEWGDSRMTNGTLTRFLNLKPGTSYRFRLHRLTPEGVSLSEISDWFKTFDVNYIPKEVSNLTLGKIGVNTRDNGLWAEINFQPSEDRSCSYSVLYWSGEHNLMNFHVRKPMKFHLNLTHLDYNKNNTVFISSMNDDGSKISNQTILSFLTPSCWDIHRNLKICAPKAITGLSVKNIRKYGSMHDILISWDKPDFLPNNYTIEIESFQYEGGSHLITVPGNTTNITLSKIELGIHHTITVVAESLGGISPEVSIVNSLDQMTVTAGLSYYDIIIVFPMLVTITILVGIVYIRFKKQKKKCNSHYMHFEALNQKDNRTGTIKSSLKRIDYSNAQSNEDSLLKDEYDLNPDHLQIQNILGSGAYGIVRLGLLQDNNGKLIKVAVKTLKDNPSIEDVSNFHQEILMMKSAGQHPNIVSLIGCCNLYKKPCLVVEYCCNGDLQSYLRKIWENMMNIILNHRTRFEFSDLSMNEIPDAQKEYGNVNNTVSNCLYDIQQDVIHSAENITASDLLNFARQVAKGMEFLSSNRIVHRDLAARNVLVCSSKIVKISDFGLSRDIYQENVYKKRGTGKLPLKWMAIEALTHQVYTTYSDVWSFGILLWEITTLGGAPYPGTPTHRILKLLRSGYRMERPINCGVELYTLMLSCWNLRPQSRPTFAELGQSLDKLLNNSSENQYLDLSKILEDPDECGRLVTDD